MKKSAIVFISILLVASLAMLTGCELNFGRDKITAENTLPQGGIANTNAPDYDFTAVVEVTDSDGHVVGSAAVSLSDKDRSANQSFFNAEAQGVSDGINESRKKTESKENDYEIIKSQKYVITGRLTAKDGTTSDYRAARDGGKYSAISNYQGKQVGLIIDNISIYLIDPSTKTYYSIPKAVVKQYADEKDDIMNVLDGSALESKKQVTSQSEEKIDGIEKMTVIKYDDGSADYYNGNLIVKTVTNDGAVLYYDSVSGDVSNGMFVPPVGYTYKSLTAETVSELAESIGATNKTNE